jgi:hypothetical protein
MAAASSFTTGGCSLLLVDAPPANAKNLKTFSCTTGNTWPVTDAVIGGLVALDSIGLLADAGSSSNVMYDPTTQTYVSKPKDNSQYVAAGLVAGAAVGFLASAYVGHQRAVECREATAELMLRLYPGNTAPAPGFAPTGFPMAPPAAYPMPAPYDPWTAPAPGAAPGAAPQGAPGPWGAPAPAQPPSAPPPASVSAPR